MGKISSYTDLGGEPADDDYLILHDEDTKSYKAPYLNFKTWAFASYFPVSVTSFNFTAGQIATLNSSPITLFTDIASTQRVIILNAVVYYNYGTAPYTDRRLVIRYGSAGDATNDSNFENSGADSVCLLAPTTTYLITNDDIIFTCNTGDPGAVGDGVMELQVTFQYINV